jgi:ABC-2 type transport system ATP-binding protein
LVTGDPQKRAGLGRRLTTDTSDCHHRPRAGGDDVGTGTGKAGVEVRELTKKYGSFTALDRLTLSVEPGQVLGFIGPNGAGKTTAIKILVGLARPTGGTATVAGIDCTAQPRKLKRVIGYMPDTFGSYDNMRVGEYLDFFGAAFGIPRRARAKRITEVLEMARCPSFRDLFVESLSHGMRQRVAVARTLLHDPAVLILDEPANGLDPPARIEMRQLLLDLAARGKTLIVTSHILPELARICDRVAILTRGKLRAFGTLDEIARQLSPLRTMEVLVTRPEAVERAAAVVREHVAAGEEVSPAPTESAVRFRTARSEEQLAGLLAALVAAGAGVAQFREVQTDLEEAFMTAARAGEAEAAAAAGGGPVPGTPPAPGVAPVAGGGKR